METKRRQYSEEFKKEAVEHSLTSEKTVEEFADTQAKRDILKVALPIFTKKSQIITSLSGNTRKNSVLGRYARYLKFPGRDTAAD